MNKYRKKNPRLFKKIKEKYSTCFYCGEYLPYEKRTIDHLIPLDAGGKNLNENLVVACETCNTNKDNLSLEEFIKLSLEGYFDKENIEKRRSLRKTIRLTANDKNTIKFKELYIDINKVKTPKSFSYPSEKTLNKRKNHFLETGEFLKDTIAQISSNKFGEEVYILREGFTNFIIAKELKLKELKIKIY